MGTSQRDTPPDRAWSRLEGAAVGRYGLAVAEDALARAGFVVTAEPNARGQVRIARRGDRRLRVHIATRRDLRYPFWTKRQLVLADDVYCCLVRLPERQAPELYLIASRAWEHPDAVLVSRDFEDKGSAPEWGINLSKRNLPELERRFAFDQVAAAL